MTTQTEQARPPCRCGCGEYPKPPKSRYRPGHDLRDMVNRHRGAGR